MIGQLDIFTSLEREPQVTCGQEVQTAASAAGRNSDDVRPAPFRDGNASASLIGESSRSSTPQTCDECGSTDNVLYGSCRPCFDAWRAAA